MKLHALVPARQAVEAVLSDEVKVLPTLPVVATKLLELTMDDRSSSDDIGKVIQTDPSITAKVLQIVNSAAYGLREKVSSVKEAISLLGFTSIRSLALGVTLFDQMLKPGQSQTFDRFFFWQHCLSVAGLSKIIAQVTNYPDPEEAYIAGLLHDIGKIIIEISGRITYSDFVTHLKKTAGPLLNEEQALMGMGHDDLGAFFGVAWDLPERLVGVIFYHHKRFHQVELTPEEGQLIAIVSLANFVSWSQGVGSVECVNHPLLQSEIDNYIRFKDLDLQKLSTQLETELQAIADFYQFSFPSPEKRAKKLLEANLELGRLSTKYYFLHDDLKRKVRYLNVSDESNQISSSENPKDIIHNTLQLIQKSYEYDRLFIMRIDPASRRLETIDSLDTTPMGMDLMHLRIPLTNQSGGFLNCLRKKESVVITGGNVLEKKVLKYLQSRAIGLVPLINNKKTVGLLGVDNALSNRPIKPSALSSAAILINELGIALENLHAADRIPESQELVVGALPADKTEAKLAEAFGRAKSGDGKLALALIEFDQFKGFKKKHGQTACANVLQLGGRSLQKLSRPLDIVGQWHQDRFLIILPNTTSSEIVLFGERIRKEFNNLGLLLTKRFPGQSLTVGVGLTAYDPTMSRPEDMLEQVGKALELAQSEGPNTVRLLVTVY